MTLYALDPGPKQSALVALHQDGSVVGSILPNSDLLWRLKAGTTWTPAHLVIEEITSYGMPVGAETFDTCVWIGRFAQAWESFSALGVSWSLLPRKAVKLALCGTLKAKDPNIRQALIDRYGGPQSVKKGGPLYGIKSHCWAALALAVAYQESVKP